MGLSVTIDFEALAELQSKLWLINYGYDMDALEMRIGPGNEIRGFLGLSSQKHVGTMKGYSS